MIREQDVLESETQFSCSRHSNNDHKEVNIKEYSFHNFKGIFPTSSILFKLKVNKFGEMLFAKGIVTRERRDSFL